MHFLLVVLRYFFFLSLLIRQTGKNKNNRRRKKNHREPKQYLPPVRDVIDPFQKKILKKTQHPTWEVHRNVQLCVPTVLGAEGRKKKNGAFGGIGTLADNKYRRSLEDK